MKYIFDVLENQWVWHAGVSVSYLLYTFYMIYILLFKQDIITKFRINIVFINLVSCVYIILHIHRIFLSLDKISLKREYWWIYETLNLLGYST